MNKIIFVIDDDRMTVELIKHKLVDHGYEVLTGYNGEEALALLGQKVPDLIILDVEMPVMDGYAFIMEKKKNPQFSKIPVVVLTSHNETQPLFKRHGILTYLIKPIDTALLIEKVKLLLGA